MKKVHMVHEDYESHISRKYHSDRIFVAVVGVFLFIAGIGGLMTKDYSLGFWLLLIGGFITWWGIKSARKHYSRIGRGKKITFG